MRKVKSRVIGVIVLTLAVMVYTIFNYLTGRIGPGMLIICIAMLGFPIVNMISILRHQKKDEDPETK